MPAKIAHAGGNIYGKGINNKPVEDVRLKLERLPSQ
jgi:hypothetical protein